MRVTFCFCLAISLLEFGTAAEPQVLLNLQQQRQRLAAPSWDAKQMIGVPNTPQPGDQATAWAAATQNDQKAWVELEYEKALCPSEIHIYETCAPGAVYQVTAVIDKKERLLWKGVDPTSPDAQMGISKIPVDTKLEFNTIRIYLNCKLVPGYNEIDAVSMIDAENKAHWAVDARASSIYNQNVNIKFVDPFLTKQDRVAEETAVLRAQINALKTTVRRHEEAIEIANAKIKKIYKQLDEITD